jgi:hypothetical protein
MRTRILVALCALALPGAASAWSHTYNKWTPQDDFPLQFKVAARADCEESVVDTLPDPENFCQVTLQAAHDEWATDAGCASLSNEYTGENPNLGYIPGNYENWNSFNDPGPDGNITTRNDDDLTDPGVLAATRTSTDGTAGVVNGVVYYHSSDSDIVFAEDINFGSTADMGAGCNNRYDFLGVATHEVGHLYGLDHSCQKDEPCSDPTLLQATMYWAGGPCDTEQQDINEDDIAGMNALYGPSASFVCSHEVSEDLAVGNVPFELKCSVVSEYLDEVDSVSWAWGDGATSTGNDASHTYESAGNYTVEVDVHGNRVACGEDGWSNEFRKVGFVRACDVPAPEFQIQHIDGLKYSMLNDTDVSVYGCYSNIEWQVYSGEGVSGEPIADLTYSGWEPNITFPDDGTYTVVLNIGGPAGTGAAQLTFDADNHRGEGYAGCDSTAAGGGGAMALSALAALAVRRGARRRT